MHHGRARVAASDAAHDPAQQIRQGAEDESLCADLGEVSDDRGNQPLDIHLAGLDELRERVLCTAESANDPVADVRAQIHRIGGIGLESLDGSGPARLDLLAHVGGGFGGKRRLIIDAQRQTFGHVLAIAAHHARRRLDLQIGGDGILDGLRHGAGTFDQTAPLPVYALGGTLGDVATDGGTGSAGGIGQARDLLDGARDRGGNRLGGILCRAGHFGHACDERAGHGRKIGADDGLELGPAFLDRSDRSGGVLHGLGVRDGLRQLGLCGGGTFAQALHRIGRSDRRLPGSRGIGKDLRAFLGGRALGERLGRGSGGIGGALLGIRRFVCGSGQSLVLGDHTGQRQNKLVQLADTLALFRVPTTDSIGSGDVGGAQALGSVKLRVHVRGLLEGAHGFFDGGGDRPELAGHVAQQVLVQIEALGKDALLHDLKLTGGFLESLGDRLDHVAQIVREIEALVRGHVLQQRAHALRERTEPLAQLVGRRNRQLDGALIVLDALLKLLQRVLHFLGLVATRDQVRDERQDKTGGGTGHGTHGAEGKHDIGDLNGERLQPIARGHARLRDLVKLLGDGPRGAVAQGAVEPTGAIARALHAFARFLGAIADLRQAGLARGPYIGQIAFDAIGADSLQAHIHSTFRHRHPPCPERWSRRCRSAPAY